MWALVVQSLFSIQKANISALLQIEIWVDDVPFKKYLETENPVD